MSKDIWDDINAMFSRGGYKEKNGAGSFAKKVIPVDVRAENLASYSGLEIAYRVVLENAQLSEDRIKEATEKFKDKLHFAGFEEPQLNGDTFTREDLEKYGAQFERSLRDGLGLAQKD